MTGPKSYNHKCLQENVSGDLRVNENKNETGNACVNSFITPAVMRSRISNK